MEVIITIPFVAIADVVGHGGFTTSANIVKYLLLICCAIAYVWIRRKNKGLAVAFSFGAPFIVTMPLVMLEHFMGKPYVHVVQSYDNFLGFYWLFFGVALVFVVLLPLLAFMFNLDGSKNDT